MRPHSLKGDIPPLDWDGLVAEAVRRRRREGLTQKEHAAMANVSVPTMVAFDRGETSLSLTKALDILRVVGLVARRTEMSSHEAFVAAAEDRWEELVRKSASDSPVRLPNGHYSFDYEIGGVAVPAYKELLALLRTAARHKYSGWAPFWIPTRKEIAPYRTEGDVAECWLGHDPEGVLRDAAHSDFWRADLHGNLYLRRGYQEDGEEAQFPPASVFDLTLPIVRSAEVLLHAHHLTRTLASVGHLVPAEAMVSVHVRFTGLAGREIKSWANPFRPVDRRYRCRIDRADGRVACLADSIAGGLSRALHSLLAPVYESFDGFVLSPELVADVVREVLGRHQER